MNDHPLYARLHAFRELRWNDRDDQPGAADELLAAARHTHIHNDALAMLMALEDISRGTEPQAAAAARRCLQNIRAEE